MRQSWWWFVIMVVPGCGSSHSGGPTDGAATDAADGARVDSAIDAVQTTPGHGGSTATCNPSPCTDPGYRGYTLMVPDSNGADAINVARTISVDRPTNLTGASPLLVVVGGGTWGALAASQRFTVLLLPNNYHCIGTPPCNGAGQYALPVVQSSGGVVLDPANYQSYPNAYGPRDCGASGHNQCDDVIWLKAALDAVMCTGPAPCADIDPTKVYVVGGSKGGMFTQAAICDTRTAPYFHAAMVAANTLVSADTSTSGGNQSAPANCPALLGTTNGIGGAAGLATNTDLSVGWMYGTQDTSACAAAPGSDCLDTGYADAKNRWQFSASQDAGDSNPPTSRGGTATGSLSGIGHALGCAGTPAMDSTYGTTGLLRKRIYTGCVNGGRATETIRVQTGGHSFPGMDGVDGFDGEMETWQFFIEYGG